MKLSVTWNVWNNYQDALLGSEIMRAMNQRTTQFEKLVLTLQGGYPELPTALDLQYFDEYHKIEIDEAHPLVEKHPKFRGVLRVLEGLKNAFNIAEKAGCHYALVTNADAWALDIDKLHQLLSQDSVTGSALSARIGKSTGLDINFGSWVPFFDDHFIILNVELCKRHNVFDWDEPKAYTGHFVDFGGIHYILAALIDERVPQGLFNAYTDLSDCRNHFGELSGFSLLPWQYQPKYGFLHANCFQEPELHPLRAEMLRLFKFDALPECGAYVRTFGGDAKINVKNDYVQFRQGPLKKAIIYMNIAPQLAYFDLLRYFVFGRYAAQKTKARQYADSAIPHFDRLRQVLPLPVASRKLKVG